MKKMLEKNKNRAEDMQDEIFRTMPADEKIKMTMSLNRFLRRIAEDSIKAAYPKATKRFIGEKLQERINA